MAVSMADRLSPIASMTAGSSRRRFTLTRRGSISDSRGNRRRSVGWFRAPWASSKEISVEIA